MLPAPVYIPPTTENTEYRQHQVSVWDAITKANGDLATLENLITANDITNLDEIKDGHLPLNFAAEQGKEGFVRLLIDFGANVNLQTRNKITALIWAAVRGDTDIVKLLIENKANVNLKDYQQRTALMWAAYYNQIEIVKLLLSNNANPNMQDQDGKTSLMIAIERENTDIIEILLEHGVDTTLKNCDGQTASDLGSSLNNDIIFELLTNHQTVGNRQKSNEKNTKLEEPQELLQPVSFWEAIASSGETPQILESVIATNGIIDLDELRNGETPFMWAAIRGHKIIANLLIKHGAKINNGNTSLMLMLIAERGHWDIFKLLIENKINIDAQNSNGGTVLIWATERNNLEAVRILVENGANVNLQNDDGTTALMIAAENGREEIVKLFLANNADVTLKDKSGTTAVSRAEKKGYGNIVKLLTKTPHDADPVTCSIQ